MIMKKQIFAALAFILALCSNALTASAATITPTGNQVWWGYFNESDFQTLDDNIGTGSPMALMAAIYVPANHEELGNATIKAIRVYADDEVASSLSDFTVFISQSLPASISAADYKLPVKDAIVGGANDVMLATPYAVNNNGFYVGYYVNSTTGYFIRTGGTGVENSFLIGNPEIEMQWGDYSLEGLGKLALQILVEGGNFKDYSATAEDFKPTVVGLGNTVNVPVTVKGMGTNTINSLSYTVTADGNTTEEKTLDNLTVAYGQKQVVDFPVDAAATVGKYTTTITITKVNGNENAATKNTATGDITTVETLTTWPRNVLIEEFTTERCVYCPQAASGLANFLKNNPDLAERVAVACHHDGYYTDWLTIAASSSYCWFYNEQGERQLTDWVMTHDAGAMWIMLIYTNNNLVEFCLHDISRSYKYPGGDREWEFYQVWRIPGYRGLYDWPTGIVFNDEETEELNNLRTDMTTYFSENYISFLTGVKPLSEWDSFVQDMKTFGMDKLLEIYQKEYDAYIAEQ